MARFSAPLIAILLWGVARIAAQAPAEFEGNPSVGSGSGPYKDSPHFRIYNASESLATAATKMLEAAHDCFVNTLGWRTAGLSALTDAETGPYYKTNIFVVDTLGGSAGQQWADARNKISFLKIVARYLMEPTVTVHEFAHALTYSEYSWVDQRRTSAWWETIANFAADTFISSPICANSRAQYNQNERRSIIDINKVLGGSYQVLVDATTGTGNYFQAWPFLSYLTYNPDHIPNLGVYTVRDMFRKYRKGSNETPLHVLERIVAPIRIQDIVGRYWARMAFVDIGHKAAQQAFQASRGLLYYPALENVDIGAGIYRIKPERQARYMGANIIPLKGVGAFTLNITAPGPFTATLAIRSKTMNTVQYIPLPDGYLDSGLDISEEANLVIANAPDSLYMYDPFAPTMEVSHGLNWQLQLDGLHA